MKIVINRCYGGFGLSEKATLRYAELADITLYKDAEDYLHTSSDLDDASFFNQYDIPRNSPELVQTVEELKNDANDRFAKLKIIEIPDNVEWTLEEYDGVEWIAEKHRTWR